MQFLMMSNKKQKFLASWKMFLTFQHPKSFPLRNFRPFVLHLTALALQQQLKEVKKQTKEMCIEKICMFQSPLLRSTRISSSSLWLEMPSTFFDCLVSLTLNRTSSEDTPYWFQGTAKYYTSENMDSTKKMRKNLNDQPKTDIFGKLNVQYPKTEYLFRVQPPWKGQRYVIF